MIFKNCIRYLYYLLKLLFYPLVALLRIVVPSSPFIVAYFTLSLFMLLSNFVWNIRFGIFLFVSVWLLGITLTVFFTIWGHEFEGTENQDKKMLTARGMIGVVLITPFILLAIVIAQIEGMDQRQGVFPFLIAITWMCVIARYYMSSLGSTIPIGILWVLGCVGFYASLWLPTLKSGTFQTLIQLEITGVLGYFFHDYLRRDQQRKYKAVKTGFFTLIILYHIFFNTFRYEIPQPTLDHLLWVAVIFITIMVASLYWSFHRGQRPR